MMHSTYSSMVRPNKVDFSTDGDGSFGNFTIYPIQRGFGVTLGNSLRRVLLSSIRGTVISSVFIDGIDHEFSVIPSVHEDVVAICLNLRKVVLRSNKESAEATLDVTGPCVVTAGMISVPEEVEVVNKDLVLFEVTGNSSVRMRFVISSGMGCVFHDVKSTSQQNSEIKLDCYFSPVKNVSFNVESTRVDEFTDYDKLVMNILTNGSIQAGQALNIASGLLRSMLESLTTFDVEGIFLRAKEVESAGVPEHTSHFGKRTSELELSVRSTNCLANAGIAYIGELVRMTEADMLKMNNFGKKSLEEIQFALLQMGLKLGMDVGDFSPKSSTPSMNVEKGRKKLQ